MSRPLRIGVLALQGNFREHAKTLAGLGVEAIEVRKPAQLEGLDGLIVPGGESTAIGRLIGLYSFEEPLRKFTGAMFGTCAGLILMAREGLIGQVDIGVERNAYGRQLASFEPDFPLENEAKPLRGVFIRAPRVTDVGEGVEVLASLDGDPVLLRQGRVLVAPLRPHPTDGPP